MNAIKPKDKYQRIEELHNRWFFHFDAREEDGIVYCQETVFKTEPTNSQLIEVVDEYYNKICKKHILEDMRWEGKQIWLSSENQLDYTLSYSIAVTNRDKPFSTSVKCYNDDGTSEHIVFSSVDEFESFITAMHEHINKCLEECRKKKESEFGGTQAFRS